MASSHTSYPELENCFYDAGPSEDGRRTFIYKNSYVISLTESPKTPEDFYKLARALGSSHPYYKDEWVFLDNDYDINFLLKNTNSKINAANPLYKQMLAETKKKIAEKIEEITNDMEKLSGTGILENSLAISKDFIDLFGPNYTFFYFDNELFPISKVRYMEIEAARAVLRKEIRTLYEMHEDYQMLSSGKFDTRELHEEFGESKQTIDSSISLSDIIHKLNYKLNSETIERDNILEFKNDLLFEAAIEGYLPAAKNLQLNERKIIDVNFFCPEQLRTVRHYEKVLSEIKKEVEVQEIKIKDLIKKKIHNYFPNLVGAFFNISDLATARKLVRNMEQYIGQLKESEEKLSKTCVFTPRSKHQLNTQIADTLEIKIEKNNTVSVIVSPHPIDFESSHNLTKEHYHNHAHKDNASVHALQDPFIHVELSPPGNPPLFEITDLETTYHSDLDTPRTPIFIKYKDQSNLQNSFVANIGKLTMSEKVKNNEDDIAQFNLDTPRASRS